jgi:hypothetical protein
LDRSEGKKPGFSEKICILPESEGKGPNVLAASQRDNTEARSPHERREEGGDSEKTNTGHAFVLDGYDSLDFVHVNWGWYGSSNGYFRINHLDPSSLGEGGGAGGYNLSQDMVTGIRPAVDGSTRDHAIYGESRTVWKHIHDDVLCRQY